ncbi:type I DNA topoisomerase [Reinekea blandensis]|uniref:DNA topoisomerase 1 n=1 Tax=Reinekea blandensis MED297 TaxID=314283 RepID=A4BJY7_9GAMM|nr:type I DNA topoisomerase [Reinekea blandensis]EAR07588.1 topoisomerase I [Reinekea sp. MED297] [Reinekea blandensis MED297]
MKLMIVESPNKCKKIAEYLGAGWMVKASVGHIRDLPQKDLGVDVENRFRPAYVISEGKHKVVKDLQAAAAKADEVWLATDPDREGEAIAYHIRTVLGLKDNYKRVTFNEINKGSIQKALASPRKLNMQMVAAQETRRILDRLVGYTVSPALQAQSSAGMSAGRVQSPAVRLVVDREREIQGFTPQDHYTAVITLDNGLEMKLDTKPLQNAEGLVTDPAIIDAILHPLSDVIITKAATEPKQVNPKPVFTTSELQQVASTKLGLSPDQTMKQAQSLFEAGRITYHRTDDPNLSDDGWAMIAAYLESQGIPVSPERRKWKAKDANAQEAHEGIRPTSMTDEPGQGDTDQLYRLIYERAMAAVTVNGVDISTQVIAKATLDLDVPVEFKASGKVVETMGWRQLMTIEVAESKDTQLKCVPDVDQVCAVAAKSRKDQVTTPPARYTEASLVKELEKRGIGRPSTYATIFVNVFRRQYLEVGKGRQITPTPLGVAVVDALMSMEFMDYDYTANLESQLDQMVEGRLKLLDVVGPAYQQIVDDLPKVSVNQSSISQFEQGTQEACIQCGHPIKRLPKKSNPKQFFWVHVDEAHAEGCEKFIDDMRGKPYMADLQSHQCKLCNGDLERAYSKAKNRHFWVHKDDSDCAKRTYQDRSGKPVLDALPCPGCGFALVRRKKKNKNPKTGKFEHFWVHIDADHVEGCEQFIDDQIGKPALKSSL